MDPTEEFLATVPGIALAATGVVAMWLFTTWGIARLSGWRALAARYGTPRVPEGESFRFESVSVGWANYGGCVRVVVSAEGLYLGVLPLFRIGHPPLLIPWKEVAGIAERTTLGIFKYVEVVVGSPPIATVKVRPRILDAMKRVGQGGGAGVGA